MSYDLKKCLILDDFTIRSTLKKIDENKYGFVFTKDSNGKVNGLVTDGDIRRAILDDTKLDEKISSISNKKFLWAGIDECREQLLKNLDGHIQFIPILDDNGKLVKIVSKNYLPLEKETNTYIRARAPVRVSFGGGGSDLTHFFLNTPGAVVNAAISIYSHALMKVRPDSKIIIHSHDLGKSFSANNLEEALILKEPFGLIQSILHVIKPEFGFQLSLNSDFSVGSGLGGSATLCAAVLGCFNEVRQDKWSQYELAEIAFQAERLHLGIAGGWQDQYATVFGGFNFIEFHKEENIVNPIRVHCNVVKELEESLVLCDTGISHNSGNIHENQKATMTEASVNDLVRENVKLTHTIRKHLLKGNLPKLGECLDAGWNLKRNFSSMISNENIDEIYNGAKNHGAMGGKLLGAGGGGYFLFYVPPFEKHRLLDFLKTKGLKTQSFRFEWEGLDSWVARDIN